MAAEDLMATRHARTMSAIGNEARMRGWADPLALAVTVAQMLAVATRVPASTATDRFLDRSFELSSAEWQHILREVAVNEPRLQPFLSVAGDMSDRPSQPFPPGLIDSVRRHLLDAIAPDIEDATFRGAAPLPLLLAVLDLARDPMRGDAHGLTRHAQILLANALAVRPEEHVYLYCAQVGAAGLALFLAAERGARVRLDVVERQGAALILWLVLAGRLDVDARVSLPLSRVGSPTDWPWWGTHDGEKYDVAILLPPFGELRARGLTDDAWHSLGLVPASSLDGLYVMLAAMKAARAACVTSNSFLFRTTRAEQLLKERVIRQHGLDTVIGLPRETLGRHGGPQASILIFHAGPELASGWQILMVDAKQAAEIDPNGWHERVGAAVRTREDSEISIGVSMEEIARQDFNITVERYVLDPEARRARDLLAEAIPLDELAGLYRPQALTAGRGLPMPASDLLENAPDLLEVGVTDIDEAGILRQPKKLVPATPEVVQRSRKSRLEPGDILLVIKGSVGKVGYVREIPEGETWLASQSFVIVRLNRHGPIADPLVLFRFLSSEIGQAAIRKLTVGTVIPGLQMADVRRVPVLIPPLAAQAAIVDEMRALLTLHDRIVAMRDEFSARMRIMWPEDPARTHEGG
jgi:hypothetical protein